jgi:hypothetical protein
VALVKSSTGRSLELLRKEHVPTLAIEGAAARGRTSTRICGERKQIQDAILVVLLRLAATHVRSPGKWETRQALRITGRNTTTRIRDVFRGKVRADFNVVESNYEGEFRLNPSIVVERIDWEALSAHPDDGIRKIAEEERRRRAGMATEESGPNRGYR